MQVARSSVARRAFQAGAQGRRVMAAAGKHTLYDVPVSNNGARVRYVIYKKGLQGSFDIKNPQELGGLKSPEYMKLNPQGKMPLLVTADGNAVPESEVIVQYLLDKFSSTGPSLQASTPEARALGGLMTRIHDVYIVPIQGCMYRKMDSAEQRSKDIQTIKTELDALEQTLAAARAHGVSAGPFICGPQPTAADGALAPTFVFMVRMLPKYFGWSSVFAGRPHLSAWWDAVQQDADLAKVCAEVHGGLDGWEKNNRWQDQGIIDQIAANPQLKWT